MPVNIWFWLSDQCLGLNVLSNLGCQQSTCHMKPQPASCSISSPLQSEMLTDSCGCAMINHRRGYSRRQCHCSFKSLIHPATDPVGQYQTGLFLPPTPPSFSSLYPSPLFWTKAVKLLCEPSQPQRMLQGNCAAVLQMLQTCIINQCYCKL